uniref:Uncharacterized protein n=1 Tax=Hemiselmis andersenii TaxID=464988 RepID=A0A6T8NPQ3_HEMAN|mmetsp:Transcript_7945/g.18373  ORF Transcript_7945/g.18373 Transcript_7945/m.18373 type:complete len:101 (-) Transcript_7945:180-482(-)|eukprot:CAMPEP_0172005050 /NCGR_PEP_ID=MMETSP1041-20130122/4821_1 /TAXON_ID=464988 /ORGANISM="Hemiselmis andersenii, Strain CCMP439" /LENGTH=100 /DNA_ID=CAMNT_0012658981 /DNA_START=80 /DNA_END=382 /DNA_ORIENTATION=-
MGATHSTHAPGFQKVDERPPAGAEGVQVKPFVDPRSPVDKRLGYRRTPLAERRANFNGVTSISVIAQNKKMLLKATDPRSPTVPRSPVERSPSPEVRESP